MSSLHTLCIHVVPKTNYVGTNSYCVSVSSVADDGPRVDQDMYPQLHRSAAISQRRGRMRQRLQSETAHVREGRLMFKVNNKHWRMRHVIIRGFTLTYYMVDETMNPNLADPCGDVDLRGTSLLLNAAKYKFTLIRDDIRPMAFKAEGEKSMDAWVVDVSKVCDLFSQCNWTTKLRGVLYIICCITPTSLFAIVIPWLLLWHCLHYLDRYLATSKEEALRWSWQWCRWWWRRW